jgi:hypothetical protein
MNLQVLIIASGFLLVACFTQAETKRPALKNTEPMENQQPTAQKMTITVGSKTFTALLYDNPSAKALEKMLPLTLNMSELNSNEKYADLPDQLVTKTEKIGTIHEGDILLWGANTLVLFYKTFQTTYSYTKIGKIENSKDLAAALGTESVMVSFTSDSVRKQDK